MNFFPHGMLPRVGQTSKNSQIAPQILNQTRSTQTGKGVHPPAGSLPLPSAEIYTRSRLQKRGQADLFPLSKAQVDPRQAHGRHASVAQGPSADLACFHSLLVGPHALVFGLLHLHCCPCPNLLVSVTASARMTASSIACASPGSHSSSPRLPAPAAELHHQAAGTELPLPLPVTCPE